MAAVDLDAQVATWRSYLQRRRAIAPADVDELEDHLRGQVADLRAVGLDDGEAFLVAIGRIGGLDEVSREFAAEHHDRLWKQLVLVPPAGERGRASWRELAVVLGCAVLAGAAVRAGLTWLELGPLLRSLSLLVAPAVAGYLLWKRQATWRLVGVVLGGYALLALALHVQPFRTPADLDAFAEPIGATELLAAVHAPVLAWLLVAVAYLGGRWRDNGRRMDVVRFTGELAVYYVLLALGGGVLIALTLAVTGLVGAEPDRLVAEWILPFAMPGALVVAAWLVEAKQEVVENIAPVLARVFVPLTLVMLVGLLVVLAGAGSLVEVDRDLLIWMDAILLLVLGLLLYSTSARDPMAAPGPADALQLALVVAALAVDAVGLTAMLARIAEFGTSPNKAAALGLNVLLLVQLVGTAVLTGSVLRGRRAPAALGRWQTAYLPVYAAWAAAVVVGFGLVFGYV